MTRSLDARLAGAYAAIAVLVVAILVAAFPVTAGASVSLAESASGTSIASTDRAGAPLTAADGEIPVSTLGVSCSSGTRWTSDSSNAQQYAWAKCTGTAFINEELFRSESRCNGGALLVTSWATAPGDNVTKEVRGPACPRGQRVTYHGVGVSR